MSKEVTPLQEVKLLSFLTDSLHLELQIEIFSPWLSRHHFFSDYLNKDSKAVHELFSVAIKRQAYAAKDALFQVGVVASHMYFVTKGLLRYQLPSTGDVERSEVLRDGAWLSEAVLWLPWVHKGSATMLLDSEVAVLSSREFMEVTVRYPDTYDLARNRANVFLELLLSQEEIHDVPVEERAAAVNRKSSMFSMAGRAS